jgi:hypothetical protein
MRNCYGGVPFNDSLDLILMSVWRFKTCDIIHAFPNINRYFEYLYMLSWDLLQKLEFSVKIFTKVSKIEQYSYVPKF